MLAVGVYVDGLSVDLRVWEFEGAAEVLEDTSFDFVFLKSQLPFCALSNSSSFFSFVILTGHREALSFLTKILPF